MPEKEKLPAMRVDDYSDVSDFFISCIGKKVRFRNETNGYFADNVIYYIKK